ncbi:AfsR family transcriptional regulator [Streptomyces armeniacus]|uniref:AfsR family transcriptional regulator n=1 Tax=Streptomyces armeniacus TaxID=83291 RepID=A0A345XZI2_9ACTN|nr:AfsR/SARP family transcriptional regulator [Streptomyces armeniacus]AXK37048.1 AfsR family transcriptional regulator [Streptomyces armeniacus]
MRIQLLGPLSITDGREVAVLRPSKPTILLAALLLHANSVVSVDCLLRAVWGAKQPTTAKAALQTCVLRLRRLLAAHGVSGAPVEAVPGGYRMRASPRTLDLLGFRERVRTAGALGLAADGGPEAELYALKDALTLWQGSLLANVPSPELHRDEVPRLIEERLRALERACELELALGRCADALAELWGVTRMYPGHERFRQQLIEALYRTGRQTEALAEYRRIKRHLCDELGVDPSPALQRLEQAMLRGEELGGEGLGAAVTATVTRPPAVRLRGLPPRAPAREPGCEPLRDAGCEALREPVVLRPAVRERAAAHERAAVYERAPVHERPLEGASCAVSEIEDVPSFTGRAAEVDALTLRLGQDGAADRCAGQEPAPVLVSGAPGTGKTALARRVAHLLRGGYPGGALLVRMVRPDGTPRGSEDVARELAAVRRRRGSGRALLVFDDVVEAEQIRPLLPAALVADTALPSEPGSDAALITSRRGLAGLVVTHGGWVHRLGTLDDEESRQLLLSVLGAQRVEAEPEAAGRIVETCGRHPLALRIAAARLQTRPGLGLADAADWLAADPLSRLALTDDPDLSVPRVFGLALDRLDPRMAEAFLRAAGVPSAGPAGVFRAEDAAGRLDMAVPEAEQVLDQLVDAGLLEDGPPGPYRMHPLLRAYARSVADGTRAGQREGVN